MKRSVELFFYSLFLSTRSKTPRTEGVQTIKFPLYLSVQGRSMNLHQESFGILSQSKQWNDQ